MTQRPESPSRLPEESHPLQILADETKKADKPPYISPKKKMKVQDSNPINVQKKKKNKKKKKQSSNIIKGLEGMANPESGGSQSSSRTRKRRRLDETCYPNPVMTMLEEEVFYPRLATNLERKERQLVARKFRSDYTYGTSTFVEGCTKSLGHTKDAKTCIWSGGTSVWDCKSSGIMWVAVHGVDSICVVTRDEKLDKKRVGGLLECKSEMEILHLFKETVITEIEDLADLSSGFHEVYTLDESIMKPFGVVSVIRGLDKLHAECSHEAPASANFYKEKAIKFLEEKMKSGLAFTYNETIQIAISAFQQLFNQNFNAKEIRVCARKDDISLELESSDIMKYL